MFSKNFFVTKLNKLMQEQKLTKQALAEIMGISRQAVSKIANGINMPTIDNLVLIADYFNVSIDYLVGRNDDPQHQYYLQRFEDTLLLDMPSPFIRVYNYAKTKGLTNEKINDKEHFELLHMFEEWKNLCVAQTGQTKGNSAHRDSNMAMKLQKLERNLEILIDFPPAAKNRSDQNVLASLPDRLIDHLYQITENDMQHSKRQ